MTKDHTPGSMAEAIRKVLRHQPTCTVHVWTKEVRKEIEQHLSDADKRRCSWKVYR